MLDSIDHPKTHIEQACAIGETAPVVGRYSSTSTDDWEGTAREIHYLVVALGLMKALFAKLRSLRSYDAGLKHAMAVKAPAILEELGAAQRLIRELTKSSDRSNDWRMIEHAKTRVRLLGRELDALSDYLDALLSSSEDPLIESEFFGAWMAHPER
jgi:hypothetical protein